MGNFLAKMFNREVYCVVTRWRLWVEQRLRLQNFAHTVVARMRFRVLHAAVNGWAANAVFNKKEATAMRMLARLRNSQARSRCHQLPPR
eukprot:COSAG01_NODE_12265_length_1770_cov_1.334530_2_plen_89_part_00